VLAAKRGHAAAARESLAQGEAILRQLGDGLELGKLLCRRAECELLAGDRAAARAAIEEAERLRDATASGAGSPLGVAVARVRERIG
jgi:hypothetical protein